MEYDTGAALDPPDPDQPGTDLGTDVLGTDVLGTDVPPRAGRRRKGVAIAAGVTVLVVGGAAAAVAAGTAPSGSPSATPTTSPTPTASPGERASGDGRDGRGLPWALGGGALHGRLTVPGRAVGGTSAYEDVLVQRGTVTAVSPTSLAVRSADGYAHTYTLTSSTLIDGRAGDVSTLAVDDTVGVLATTDSTARYVQEGRGHRGAAPGAAGPGAAGPGSTAPGEGQGKGYGSRPPWPEGRVPGARPGEVPPGMRPGEATPGSAAPGAGAPGAGRQPSTQGGTDT